MKYRQLSGEERSALGALRLVGLNPAEIGRELGRHRSTVWRELRRNRSRHDGRYRAQQAQEQTQARRRHARRNSQFGQEHWARVEGLLKEQWSPEQVSGHLRLQRELAISHETIYRHIWQDLRRGGTLHEQLRGARKSCRKRYGRYDSRGRLGGKRMIWERPRSVERRHQTGHWEIDTMMGESPGENSHCVLTLVERKSGYLMIGKLAARTAAETNRALLGLLARHPGADAHDHRGQRDRVPLVWTGGSAEPGQVLLRHTPSQLGARDEREHQRTHPAVSPQGANHGPSHAKRLRSNRPTP